MEINYIDNEQIFPVSNYIGKSKHSYIITNVQGFYGFNLHHGTLFFIEVALNGRKIYIINR